MTPGVLKRLFVLGARARDDAPRRARALLIAKLERELGPIDPRYSAALLEVPRERFVRAADAERAAEDLPLPLDDAGRATISAPHAYVLSFALAELGPGDTLLELGSGSGYGAALAAHVVGAEPATGGHVTTIEIDPELAARAKELLAGAPNVTALEGDAATMTYAWLGVNKVICTFAVARIPDAWLALVPEGGVLVAPVGPPDRTQHLVRVRRVAGELVATTHSAVRYVPNRSRSVDHAS